MTHENICFIKKFYQLSKLNIKDLSPIAKERLRLLRAWKAMRLKGINSHEASKIPGIPRSTLYRWEKRLKEEGIKGLEPKSKRPKRTRKKSWSYDLIEAIKELRLMSPSWGKRYGYFYKSLTLRGTWYRHIYHP